MQALPKGIGAEAVSNLRACSLPCGKERDAEIERLKAESARWFRYYSGLLEFVDPSVLVGYVQKAANEIAAERQQARLPEELAARLQEMIDHCWGMSAGKNQAPMERLLRDILAWHEQQGGRSDE